MTEGRRPCDNEAETGLNAKDCQQPRGLGWTLPQSLQKESMILKSSFRISGFQNGKRINSCFTPPSSPRKRMQSSRIEGLVPPHSPLSMRRTVNWLGSPKIISGTRDRDGVHVSFHYSSLGETGDKVIFWG